MDLMLFLSLTAWCGADEIEHIRALEKEKGVTPDWDINAYMVVRPQGCGARDSLIRAGIRDRMNFLRWSFCSSQGEETHCGGASW